MIGHRGSPADERFDDPLTFGTDVAFVLPRMIQRQAASRPDAVFLVEVETGRTATYAEFWLLARRWSGLLLDAGVSAGDRVVSLLPGSIDAHSVWIGASLIEAWEISVNPDLRGRFLDHALTSCTPTIHVVRPEHLDPEYPGSGDLAAALGGRDDVIVVPRAASPVDGVEPLDPADHLPTPRDVSCVIYTSGTAGAAKGVVTSWGQLATTIGRIPRSWLGPTDSVYCPWPMFHVTGRSPLFAMADLGGRVVLRERFSRQHFWYDIDTNGCTVATAGTVAGMLLAGAPRPDDRRHSLQHAFLGTGRTALDFVERFGVNGISCYGSTEVGFPISNPSITAADHDSIGWLRPGYEARVVDGSGSDADHGTTGELLVRPPDRALMLLGYLGQTELTAVDGDGWYHTGDAVTRLADGRFVFAGRLEDTIRRYGENISTVELERAIVEATGISACAVVTTPSEVAGVDLVLCVPGEPGNRPDPAALHDRLRRALPRYMLPSRVCMVDELPTTPTGKLQRRALADQLDLASCWSADR